MSSNMSDNISESKINQEISDKAGESKSMQKPENLKNIIGERLRLVREANGYRTRASLVLKNINIEYFAKVEKGQHSIAVDTLYIICKEFNISISEFMKDIDLDLEKNASIEKQNKIIINNEFKKMLIDKYQ